MFDVCCQVVAWFLLFYDRCGAGAGGEGAAGSRGTET